MNKTILFFFFVLTAFIACKKDADFGSPLTSNFSGQYTFSGSARKLTGSDTMTYPFFMGNIVDPSGNYYELKTDSYSNHKYRLTNSGLRKNLFTSQFNLFVYAGLSETNDIVDNQWTIAELDTIFQVGKVLPFGESFGQIGIEFADQTITSGRIYESILADNTNNSAHIEKVEDMATFFPDAEWVKKVTMSFHCRLKNAIDPSLPEVELFDCRATLLFKPRVKK